MTVRLKIITGFAIILVIGLVLGVFGIITTNTLTNLSEQQNDLQNASSGVASVLNAHYVWRQGITEAVYAGKAFTGSLDPNGCALGKWRVSEEAQSIDDPEVLSLLNKVTEPHDYIHTEAGDTLEMLNNGDRDAAIRDLEDNLLPRTAEVISILTGMQERYVVMLDAAGDEVVRVGNMMTTIVIVLIVIAVALSVFLAFFITLSIMKPIVKMTNAAEMISIGDLDVNVDYSVNDEIGRLAKAFKHMVAETRKQEEAAEAMAEGNLTVNIAQRSDKDSMNRAFGRMIEKFNDMFAEIQSNTQQVTIGSREVADGAQMLAQGSTEQAATIEALLGSIGEIAERTNVNAEIASKTSGLSETIKTSAEKGSQQMSEMITAVGEITEASRRIGKIIKTIDDIAFQTNILALNAAVEAARAGQHGKGFAVVAEEVRNLASKSADAAKDTGDMIQNSMDKAELGARIAEETAASLTEIVTGINETNQLVVEIAKSSEEQSAGIAILNTGIDQVAQVIQQISETAHRSAAASEEMSEQSNILQQLIAQFRLKNDYSAQPRLPGR